MFSVLNFVSIVCFRRTFCVQTVLWLLKPRDLIASLIGNSPTTGKFTLYTQSARTKDICFYLNRGYGIQHIFNVVQWQYIVSLSIGWCTLYNSVGITLYSSAGRRQIRAVHSTNIKHFIRPPINLSMCSHAEFYSWNNIQSEIAVNFSTIFVHYVNLSKCLKEKALLSKKVFPTPMLRPEVRRGSEKSSRRRTRTKKPYQKPTFRSEVSARKLRFTM